MLNSSIKKIELKPIGIVHTEASDEQIRREIKDVEAVIEVFPEFEEGLKGVDGYSHLFILSYLHKLRSEQVGPLKVKPKRLVNRGFKAEELPLLGVFALDSPTRPNPIGLTLVKLVKRHGRKLFVSGADLFDGTPVIDIKPYQPDYRTEEYTLPQWYINLMNKAGHV